jgi:hypothetical protein
MQVCHRGSGFLAYTRPFYKPEAAKLAWSHTMQFLRTHLN